MMTAPTHVMIVFCALLLVAGLACSGDNGSPNPNLPPSVRIVSGPPEGGTTNYTPTIFWDGFDQDGDVLQFEYVITNNVGAGFDPADTTGANKWTRTNRFDDTFMVSADLLADSTTYDVATLQAEEYIRGHTFLVHSIDNEGLRSLTPAQRSFKSRTLSPVVDVTVPLASGTNPVTVGPVVNFQWSGTDYISSLSEVLEPEDARWVLVAVDSFASFADALNYVRMNPSAPEWSDWLDYQALDLSGRTLTTDSLAVGEHLFAVQVRDEAGAVSGAVDEARNVRRINVVTSIRN